MVRDQVYWQMDAAATGRCSHTAHSKASARELLAGKHVAFVGDSIMRKVYYTFWCGPSPGGHAQPAEPPSLLSLPGPFRRQLVLNGARDRLTVDDALAVWEPGAGFGLEFQWAPCACAGRCELASLCLSLRFRSAWRRSEGARCGCRRQRELSERWAEARAGQVIECGYAFRGGTFRKGVSMGLLRAAFGVAGTLQFHQFVCLTAARHAACGVVASRTAERFRTTGYFSTVSARRPSLLRLRAQRNAFCLTSANSLPFE